LLQDYFEHLGDDIDDKINEVRKVANGQDRDLLAVIGLVGDTTRDPELKEVCRKWTDHINLLGGETIVGPVPTVN